MRVVIADDTRHFAAGLAAALAAIGVEVIGIAHTVDALRRLVDSDPPDVAIIDIALPDNDEGLQAAERLAATHPRVGVLLVSAYNEAEWEERVFARRRHGVGYIPKRDLDDVDVRRALRQVADGERYLDPRLAPTAAERRLRDMLTDRQYEVGRLVAEGRTNAAIAEQLGISERTAENHVNGIGQRLGLDRDGGNNARVGIAHAYWEDERRHGAGS